jgi:hypothetical protein
MKLCSFQVVFSAVSVAALLLLVSCASKPEDEKNTSTAYREGVPGGTWIESYRIPVTVAAIDPANRKVTLVASDNSRNTFTAGSDFKGFDQLRVGDKVQAAVARELIVFLRQHGLPPQADTSAAKELKTPASSRLTRLRRPLRSQPSAHVRAKPHSSLRMERLGTSRSGET